MLISVKSRQCEVKQGQLFVAKRSTWTDCVERDQVGLHIRKLYHSIPDRLGNFIEMKGHLTKY